MAHGVFFDLLSGTPAAPRTQAARNVGLAAPVPAGSTGFAIGDLKVIRGATDVADLGLPPSSDLQKQFDLIYAQYRAPVVLFGTDPGADTAEAATNLAGSASLNTGIYKFKEAQSILGVHPDILIAPGFADPAVHASLIACCNQIQSVCILDGPSTDDASVIAQAAATTDDNGVATMVDPRVDIGSGDYVAASAAAAGIYSGINWWDSPSNNGINGITGTERAIFHELTNDADQAQALNDANVTTIVQNSGYRLWGNRNLSAPGFNLPFISTVRADQQVRRAIAEAHLFWVDKNITSSYASNLVESINSFLRQQKSLDRIAGGEAILDPEINTPESLQAGNAYFNLEMTYLAPAENITFRRSVTARFYEGILP